MSDIQCYNSVQVCPHRLPQKMYAVLAEGPLTRPDSLQTLPTHCTVFPNRDMHNMLALL